MNVKKNNFVLITNVRLESHEGHTYSYSGQWIESSVKKIGLAFEFNM